MAIHRVDDLEIGEDLPYQRKQWIVQRVSWGIWLGVLVVAMFGV
jgi:hypothetical protein